MKFKKKILMMILTLFFAVSFVSAEDKGLVEETEDDSHIGTVVLTKETSKYTYMKLDENGEEVWIAAEHIKVSVGDKVEYTGGVLMEDFQSKAMNRTFDKIRLITWIKVLNKDTLSEQNNDHFESNSTDKYNTVTIPLIGEIAKADGGKTIEEIFTEKDQLSAKEVVLRGRVMKVIENILGKTWVTLQDGTGIDPDNMILAVTQDIVIVGDILTVKGILQTNVSLGSGYKYKVLIDEAKFTK